MKGQRKFLLISVMIAVLIFPRAGLGGAAAQVIALLTQEEGTMGNAPPGPIDVGNSLNTGPSIEVIKPEQNVPLYSPILILVRFVPIGKDVDLSALKVEVLKLFTIDITKRVFPYATQEGIHVENASLPSGEHKLRVTIGDVDGGISQKVFQVTIL